jgi:hypothetical protein
MRTQKLLWDLSVLKEAFHEACESKQLVEVRWLVQFIKTKLLEQLADEEQLRGSAIGWLSMEIELKSILGIRQLINIAMEYACKRGQTSLIKCLVQHTYINVNNTISVSCMMLFGGVNMIKHNCTSFALLHKAMY